MNPTERKPFVFFFSYAREDGESKYINRFFADLQSSVSRAIGLDKFLNYRDPGFQDKSTMILGDPWAESILYALQNSQVLVCLYSPTYFTRDYCGKEYEVFLQRMRQSGVQQSRNRLILPILWEVPKYFINEMPPIAYELQYSQLSLDPSYFERGLRSLLVNRLSKYKECVESITECIVQAASFPNMPPLDPAPNLADYPSAWRRPAKDIGRPIATADRLRNKGPRAANFAFLSTKGLDWRPYDATAQNTVLGIVIKKEELSYDFLQIDSDLKATIIEADNSNTPVFVLVDPDSVSKEPFYTNATDLASLKMSNFEILMPLAQDYLTLPQDPTSPLAPFRSLVSQNASYFRFKISSQDELQTQLSQAIIDVQARIRNRSENLQPVNPGGPLPTVTTNDTPKSLGPLG